MAIADTGEDKVLVEGRGTECREGDLWVPICRCGRDGRDGPGRGELWRRDDGWEGSDGDALDNVGALKIGRRAENGEGEPGEEPKLSRRSLEAS